MRIILAMVTKVGAEFRDGSEDLAGTAGERAMATLRLKQFIEVVVRHLPKAVFSANHQLFNFDFSNDFATFFA